jgi:hypothetical protein
MPGILRWRVFRSQIVAVMSTLKGFRGRPLHRPRHESSIKCGRVIIFAFLQNDFVDLICIPVSNGNSPSPDAAEAMREGAVMTAAVVAGPSRMSAMDTTLIVQTRVTQRGGAGSELDPAAPWTR